MKVYSTADWSLVKAFADHKQEVTGVRFGQKAASFATVSRDRTLKLYGAK